jgi:ParB family chromosome partitioning protein
MSRDSAGRLGRGLAALLGEEAAEPSETSSIRSVAIETLEPGPYQPRRIADSDLTDLVSSIRAHGVLQPLLVRPHPSKPGRLQIIAGERRWRAAQAAGLPDLPVLVRELGDSAAMAAALVENLQREDLNPIEEAEGYRRLIEEFGMTQDALGTAIGKSRSHVTNTMRLLRLPPDVQGALRAGQLSAGHARALLSHPDPARAAQTVIAKGLNVRQTETLAAKAAQPSDPTPDGMDRAARRDPDLVAVERTLTQRLGLKVEIAARPGGGGSMRLHYQTLDQLEGLLALLNHE